MNIHKESSNCQRGHRLHLSCFQTIQSLVFPAALASLHFFFQFFLIPKCLSYNCRHTSPLAFKDLYFKASLILNRAPEIKNTTSWTKLWALTHLYSGHEWLSEHYLNFLTSAVFVYESERGVTTRNKQLEVFKISDILQIFEIPIEEELIIIII